jgi:hypothetical protein
MARKQSRRITSSQGSGKGSSGARKRKSKSSILRGHRGGKPATPQTRRKVFAAAALVRRGEASLPEALRQEQTSLRSFLKFPQLYRRQPDGTLRVTNGDTYKRHVKIYIPLRFRDGDVRTVAVHSYKEAAFASRFVETVEKVRRGKLPPAALKEFDDVRFGREKYRPLTDFTAIKRLADAGIRIDEFYAEPGGSTS